jgi:hypothetical protein
MWRRALRNRAALVLGETNRGARARGALAAVLARAGRPCSLVTIHAWSRAEQGQAYLWALDFIHGREDVPPPEHVARASR